MSSGTIFWILLVVVGPLSMIFMHRGHGGHGGHGGHSSHGGGSAGPAPAPARPTLEPKRPALEGVRRPRARDVPAVEADARTRDK